MNLKTLAAPFALLLLAGPGPVSAAPIPPPLITVQSLFTEVIIGQDENLAQGHWELFGAHALEAWPQGEPAGKAAGLSRVAQEDTFLPVQVLTPRPVRLTREAASLAFFRGVPTEVPRDGSRIGFKYVFHPNAVVDLGQEDPAAGKPIAFYLVRPAPADLSDADLAQALHPEVEDDLVQKERNAYNCLASSRALDRLPSGRIHADNLLKAAADAGLVQAQFSDGEREARRATPEGLARARHRYRQAAEQGLAKAQAKCALMFYLGQGGAVDLAVARTWYQRAAEHGMADCQAALANLLAFGQGGPVDPVAARAWAQRAAGQDFQMGHLILGRMLQDGQGGPVDRAGARAQYQRAVAQGGDLATEARAAMEALPEGEGGQPAWDEDHGWLNGRSASLEARPTHAPAGAGSWYPSLRALPSATHQQVNMGQGVHLDLVLIPAGTFMMGSLNDRPDERPAHQVTISQAFWLGQYSVTQAQWEAVMGSNPSHSRGPELPVEHVSWDDCQQFLAHLNAQGHGTFRLPTESEWEYACRAGSTGERYGELDAIAWHAENSHHTPHPVGQKQPNAFGLYDMNGNVWQWCQDWYGAYPSASVTDPKGPSSGSGRVVRGGGWGSSARNVRSAFRGYCFPGSRDNDQGLRLLRIKP